MVNCFIEHGCSVNDAIDGGYEDTAIHLAAKFGLDLYKLPIDNAQTHDKNVSYR